MYEEDRVILCVSNSYEKRYFLNEDFESLPELVKAELKAFSVLFTEDVGGIFVIGFNEDGELFFEVQADEGDILYDEIGSHLKIKQIQKEKQELLEALESYFRTFFM
ncbi:hypothetical protein EDC18_105158 [Natranaerovirga pectinivora]|uniref:Uncharacterized protein n=1 Tax=Natranaerovirga pectinivora TaxID=682400 RepID=A0A4R3ML32_9FIRM|nr:DUF6145 family protein [Natranaerovirga pectinivora]TCT14676.1 hypothetical protein EDC18_105158 [Natranaerovirga pectinivora]